MRKANFERKTTETKVKVSLLLDGSGSYKISTGVGFFDHMLEQLARHALFDLEVKAEGDLHIDDHHTVEDVGIALGNAFSEAFGDGVGLQRYGSCLLPMDDTLTRVALDISRRPYLYWDVEFTQGKIGSFDTELVREFFQAFAMNGGMTLHVETLHGLNSHHIAESCFKATARALRTAVEIDPRRSDASPSTKGVLG